MDEASEITSTEARSNIDLRSSFDTNIANKPPISSSPFTDKTISSFSLAAKPNTPSISPKKSPLSSSASAAGISRTSSGISGAHNFPADRHVNAGSSFMKSDHISRLNFNSVSTTSTPADTESAVPWISSFMEARTPSGGGFTFPPLPIGSFTSPSNSLDDEMSPPLLKPKVRRTSQRTPDKSPLVTSSSGDPLELGKPSIGLGQPPGFADSELVDFEVKLPPVPASGINSTPRRFSASSVENDFDEQVLCDRLPASARNAKQPSLSSRSDNSYSSPGSDHRNSHKISKPSAKATSKSRSRSAKQKAKSPTDEDYERQRAELDNAFEAACRLPSTVRGQPSSAASSASAKHRSSFDNQKVSCKVLLV